jgi:hypothetical protein
VLISNQLIRKVFLRAASILHRWCQRGGVRRDLSSTRAIVKSILDSSFRYTNSVETDLRKTFARIRREQRAVQQARQKTESEQHLKVHLLRQKAI